MLHELFDKQSPTRKVVPVSSEPASCHCDDLGSFGWLNSERDRSVMLELRHSLGAITAISYSWLESAKFDPSEGITLNFSGTTVKLVGRNLNVECRPGIRLFEGITRHRVVWIQEADEAASLESLETDVLVEEVKVICPHS